ncbi:hypothetical protein KDX23_23120 [Burkholderia vietnamiensis]|uniref:hypothetical protein n=1 Tax=Burkholderia vietnamiensis TaxID=60552 RepID=UPI001B97AA7A|nr:hypothetical protein [Burkholderia vietnamiensis]MBR8085632.1 hypothetical protein [Burkholderia vietnamiensis]
MSEAQTNVVNASTVLVEPGQMAAFEKRLESLNKKAAKFGLSPIRIVRAADALYERKSELVGRDAERLLTYLVPVQKVQDVEHPVLIKRLDIEYPEIKLGHWRVVGKLEAVEGGNLAFAVSRGESDVTALAERAECPIECEHCNTNRRRKDGYLLRDDKSGDYKEVGSNCLEDFTGIDPAAALFMAQMWSVIKIAEDDFAEFGRSMRANAVRTDRYLADVCFITENHGFTSAARARDMGLIATYDEALSLPRAVERDNALRQKYEEQFERHLEKASAVRGWITSKPEESMFDRNLKLLFASDALSLDRKHLAFAAAAVPLYNRFLANSVDTRKPSRHVGSPGDKAEGMLTIERLIPLETLYGVSDLVLMKDQDGNKFKWKTTACPSEIKNGGVGRTMAATFKIKEHGDYRGAAQTTITHLKVLRWIDVAGIGADEGGAAPVIGEDDSPAVRSAKARFLSERRADSAGESAPQKARYRP